VTATLAATDALYRRYKALALAAGAALVLGASVDDLAEAVGALEEDAIGTHCAEPASALRRLLDRARAGEDVVADVEDVRASHRSLRRRIWTTQPCEYVPCCAGGPHEHR
jgi:hypothetical protein